jgi:hypothetical protein
MPRDFLLYSLIGLAIYLVAAFIARLRRDAHRRDSQQDRRPLSSNVSPYDRRSKG